MTFTHRVRARRHGLLVQLAGELDFPVRADLRQVLAAAVARSHGTIDVDLEGVSFLDCSAVGECVRGYLAAQAAGRRLTVSRAQGLAHLLLDSAGVLAMLTGIRAGNSASGP